MGNTAAGTNIYATRLGLVNCDQYPCIGTRVDDIRIESDNDFQKREAQFELTLKTLSSYTSEEELENLIAQVEILLTPDVELLPDSTLELTDIATRYSSVGRLHFEHRVMTFQIKYHTAIPDTADLENFNSVHADWQTDQQSPAPEAQDQLTLSQD